MKAAELQNKMGAFTVVLEFLTSHLYICVGGLVQTIFGKINVIVTLWGEGVIGHDV